MGTSSLTSLPDALARAAERSTGDFVFHLDEGPVRLSHLELAEHARAGAQALAARGIGPGDAVGVIGPNRPEWVSSAFAVWAAGAALVPLQIPLRVRSREAFEEQVRALVDAGSCRAVLAAPELAFAVPEDLRTPWDTAPARGRPPATPATDRAVIQFTSGSTAAPKGAVLSHAAVLAQMNALAHILDGDASGVVMVSWVPFFHDLGLFLSLVAPVVHGYSAHILPTERFARDPAEWLRLVGRTRADVTVGPCSAWSASARSILRGGERVDLSSLRVAWFAAEGVDPDTVDGIVAARDRLHLDPNALGATYGLAETVLCAASTRPGAGLRFDHVDLDAMAACGQALPALDSARRIVCSGTPVLGTAIKIVSDGCELPDRQLGEVYLRGRSFMAGYVGRGDHDPFDDGWLRTGDIGYMADGELFITGRAKDVMIVMGRNYYPEDFEWAAGRVAGTRTGRCVAFVHGANGSERVVLLVEPTAGAMHDTRHLSVAVRRTVSDAVGVAPTEVLVLEPGTIEKTTSGKLRRNAMKEAYGRGELRPLGRGRPAAVADSGAGRPARTRQP